MRYMSWVRATKETGNPPQALIDAINAAGQEAMRDGTMIDTGGISTIREGGAKLTLAGGAIIDGPYAEAKEVAGGYAIMNHDSLEDAVQSARWLLELHQQHWPEWEGEIEIRQLFSAADMQQ